jgi:hypothetical protein
VVVQEGCALPSSAPPPCDPLCSRAGLTGHEGGARVGNGGAAAVAGPQVAAALHREGVHVKLPVGAAGHGDPGVVPQEESGGKGGGADVSE